MFSIPSCLKNPYELFLMIYNNKYILQEQSAKKKSWPIISSNNNIHCSILVDIIQATPGRWGARDDRLPEFGSFLVVTNYIGAGVNGYNLHHPITSQVSCCDLWIRNKNIHLICYHLLGIHQYCNSSNTNICLSYCSVNAFYHKSILENFALT